MGQVHSFGETFREVLPAPELLTAVSQRGMEVFQLTSDPQ